MLAAASPTLTLARVAGLGGTDVFLNDPPKDMKSMKSLKLQVSVKTHILLQSVKIMHKKNISDVVDEALREYFERHPEYGAKLRETL